MHDIEHETKMRAMEQVMSGQPAEPPVSVGEIWRLIDADPWKPLRYQVIATMPGWVRIKLVDDDYWITPRGVRVASFLASYERDRQFEDGVIG